MASKKVVHSQRVSHFKKAFEFKLIVLLRCLNKSFSIELNPCKTDPTKGNFMDNKRSF